MIAQFAIRLICGMSLMWAVMPRRDVTSGFFRIQMLVVLGLSVLAALTLGQFISADSPAMVGDTTARIACGVLAGLGYVGSIMWTLERRKAGSAIAIMIAVGSSALLLATTVDTESITTADGCIGVFSEFATSLVLGANMVGMLLGHWYLTAPTMSIQPLFRLNAFVGISGALRLIVSAISLVLYVSLLTSSTQWVWVSMRWIAGVVGPLAVFVMVHKILKYKNTQSATGVLFVGVILTFIGEMTATLLHHDLGVWW